MTDATAPQPRPTGPQTGAEPAFPWSKFLTPAITALVGAAAVWVIKSAESCSTVSMVPRFASVSEVQELRETNNTAHSALNGKLDAIQGNTEAILRTLAVLPIGNPPATPSKRKSKLNP